MVTDGPGPTQDTIPDIKQERSKTILMMAVTGAIVLIFILVFMIFMRLEIFDAGPHMIFAVFLGVFFTTLVGAGLMALTFHSDRTNYDETVASEFPNEVDTEFQGPIVEKPKSNEA